MNRTHRILFLLFFLSVVFSGIKFVFSEEIPIRIDGRVIRADESAQTLLVDFENPATKAHQEMMFDVNPGAGFKDFKKLGDLKEGDLVSLDYLDRKPALLAVYVIRIPLEKTYFTRKEIAEAVLKIKSKKA